MSNNIQDNTRLIEDEKISFGEKLKITRENRGLSVQDAAGRLHLSPRFITMLENENLQHTSLPLIYLRGYLRSYARLLHIPETELAQVLETLDPQPLVVEPPPPATRADSLSLTFPLENNPYYARVATFLVFIALLTSITAWWYLHVNAASSTLIVLKQPFAPEPEALNPQANENATLAAHSVSTATPFNLNTSTALETVAIRPTAEPTQVPEASINLAPQKNLSLAAAAKEQNKHDLAPQPAAGREENDDESIDE